MATQAGAHSIVDALRRRSLRRRRRPPRLKAPAIVLIILASWLAGNAALVWHPRTDAPSRVDAIIALGGDNDEGRYDRARQLVGQGYAPVLVTDIVRYPAPPCDEAHVICFHPAPFSTQGEARAIAALARQRDWHRITLVVSRVQALRARIRFRRCFTGVVTVVAVAPGDLAYQTLYQDAALVKAEVWQRGC